ncbi:peptidase [Paucilactobacillus hokkaidonensis JCM 18461]|uniref:Peptidase n=3 Tax=Paucilactobacillus hokkaidonensis TaxID=1193095 RepID=A0A0A1GWW1_9LACO|nr:type II CAAX endopeptidase family protein [Paucilactobacillus hokkaidonensis]KRO10096.1 abortive infection protein [Paucilactobacillus hokkaidonensis]BAP85393.1 peptidase [Paucilactobacillus hokkaidonensis JCM 18461]
MQTQAWDRFWQQKTPTNFFNWLVSLLKRIALIGVLFILIQLPPTAMSLIKNHPHLDVVSVSGLVIFVGLFLVIINWAYKLFKRYNTTSIKPSRPAQDFRTVIFGYVAIFVGQMVLGWLNAFLNHQTQTANNNAVAKLMNGNTLIMVAFSISTVLLTPFAEELIFRGVLTNLFFKPNQFWWKIILSGVVFSLGHASTTLISFLIYFYMGGVLAFVYQKTGKIKNAIMLHALNNLVAIIEMLSLLN